MPVTVVRGEGDGPTVFLSAAVHGDELNGVKVIQEVVDRYDPDQLHGALVCRHVVNVPGFLAQQRYVPVYDRDLNRAFPGDSAGDTAQRIAAEIFRDFIAPCDVGIDFHTSTRNRTTLFHVRADTTDRRVERLALSFGTNVIISGAGPRGTLRREATDEAIPTIAVEMGEAHRFQAPLVERALDGVESVLAEYRLLPRTPVRWPGWYRVIESKREKAWIRAERGGLVEMRWGPYPFVQEGDLICEITDHAKRDRHEVRAPFAGILVGVLENPVVAPGHPLCHLVRTDRTTRREIEAEIRRGEFSGYPGRDRRGTGGELDGT